MLNREDFDMWLDPKLTNIHEDYSGSLTFFYEDDRFGMECLKPHFWTFPSGRPQILCVINGCLPLERSLPIIGFFLALRQSGCSSKSSV